MNAAAAGRTSEFEELFHIKSFTAGAERDPGTAWLDERMLGCSRSRRTRPQSTHLSLGGWDFDLKRNTMELRGGQKQGISLEIKKGQQHETDFNYS